MNLKQLQESSDSLNSTIKNRINTFKEKLLSYYHFDSLDTLNLSKTQAEVFSYSSISKIKQKRLTKAAANLVRSSKSYIYNSRRELKYKHKKLRKAKIEWHRKFTLSFACIVLFLIGAPLGAIIRKGGMGMPVLISILFFLAYHISSITGEKSAIQGVLSITFGMWLSAFILTPLGIFFIIRAASDSTLFEIRLHKTITLRIKELWNRKKS